MILPNDIARCRGVGSDEEGWREGCEDCKRRTSAPGTGVTVWMTPPDVIVFWCEYRLRPTEDV